MPKHFSRDEATRASEAAREQLASEPGAQAAIRRAGQRLRGRMGALTRALQAVQAEWESRRDDPWPGLDVAEWERLAARAGLDPMVVFSGHWSFARVEPIIQGYLDRVQDDREARPAEPAGDDEAVPDCMVTLLQASAIVGRSKRTLEGYLRTDDTFPDPVVRGRKGQPNEWKWSELRPWLEKKFRRKLPARFPADRFVRS